MLCLHDSFGAQEKLRGALTFMGISITSGIFTTFFACIALYCCQFLWFKIFGYFITMLIFSSYFTSMFGMCALLATVGPNEGEGHINVNCNGKTDEQSNGNGAATPTGNVVQRDESL